MRKLIQAAAILAIVLGSAASARAENFTLRHAGTFLGDPKAGALKAPEGIACGPNGAALVADTGNGRLLRFTIADGEISPGGEIKLAQLGYPVRVQLDEKGSAIVLDRKSGRLVKLDAKGAFAGFLELKGAADPRPASFKLDPAGNVVVLDETTRAVIVADPGGAVTRQLPLPAEGEFTDVAVDRAGIIYVLDAIAARVWSADKAATAFTPFSKDLKEYVSFPGYLDTTPRGMLMVDQNGGGIAVLGQDGAYLGRQLSLGWSDGLLYYPGQICVGANGDVFVADRSNNRVQVFVAVAK